MNQDWAENIQNYIKRNEKYSEEDVLSIKIKSGVGCFHREHAPIAYGIIDSFLKSIETNEIEFIEHESGPGIIALIANIVEIINFIIAVVKAKIDGMRKGDRNQNEIEVTFRKITKKNEKIEEVIIHSYNITEISEDVILKAVEKSKIMKKWKK